MLGFALMAVYLLPMATNWGILFQFAIGLLTVAVAYYGHLQSKKGREADTTQAMLAERDARELRDAAADMEDKKQRFSELERSLAAARTDLDYYIAEVSKARARAVEVDAEWTARHNATLERCAVTAKALEDLLNGRVELPQPEKARIEQAVHDVTQHIREDHRTNGNER